MVIIAQPVRLVSVRAFFYNPSMIQNSVMGVQSYRVTSWSALHNAQPRKACVFAKNSCICRLHLYLRTVEKLRWVVHASVRNHPSNKGRTHSSSASKPIADPPRRVATAGRATAKYSTSPLHKKTTNPCEWDTRCTIRKCFPQPLADGVRERNFAKSWPLDNRAFIDPGSEFILSTSS